MQLINTSSSSSTDL